MVLKKFTVKYTSSAFEQDANQAMKGNVVRGLIELITNCDDAYARAKKTGKIEIIVRRSHKSSDPVEISVRDSATGLDPKAMEDNFGVLGGDKSGFVSGEDVRGVFSRGSKDTAWFGETVFESIKDGTYTKLILKATGEGSIESFAAENSHYQSLGLSKGENGLSATMVVRNARVPDLRTLVDRLSTHVQLRQIVSIQSVTITEFRDGKMIQSRPLVWDELSGDVLFDGLIQVPGYGCQAKLTILRLDERSDGPINEYSMHGIEVHGRRAAYMNHMFSQSGPGTAFIHGILKCEMIDDLIRTFKADGSGDGSNPMRLVSRSRDGIELEHPFTQALTAAVLEKLKPILTQLEPKSVDSGSKELRRDLDTLARLLAEKMRDDLDDDNDDTFGQVPTDVNPLIVIPPRLRARIGSKATLTVLVHERSIAAQGFKTSVSSPSCAVIEVSKELVRHTSFPETLVGQVRIEMLKLGSANVSIYASADKSVSAVAEVVVHDKPDEVQAPEALEWKNTAMSVTLGKSRSVRLRAPISLAPQGELLVAVTLESSNIRLEDGSIKLALTNNGWLEGRVYVTGIEHLPGSSPITALGANQTANGTVRTKVPSPLGGLNFEIELLNEGKGPIRGEISRDDNGTKLTIYGRHFALASRLGIFKEGAFERDHEIDTLVVMAEIMASVAADHIVMDKVKKHPELYSDIDNIVYERTKLVDKYVNILNEGLRISSE
jgi:hypothetical protein